MTTSAATRTANLPTMSLLPDDRRRMVANACNAAKQIRPLLIQRKPHVQDAGLTALSRAAFWYQSAVPTRGVPMTNALRGADIVAAQGVCHRSEEHN